MVPHSLTEVLRLELTKKNRHRPPTFLYVKDDTGGDPITLQAAAALVPPNALPLLDPVLGSMEELLHARAHA
jgi:hypothetical protein